VASLVFDNATDARAVATIKSDATIIPQLKALDCGWEWVVKEDAAATPLLAGQPTPAIVLHAPGSTQPLKYWPAPADGAGVLALVKAARGTAK
jgi:hypothetical protein